MLKKGERTKRSILGEAANIASVDGLNGLTIGYLAKSTSMSKSGLYSHFGSKEELQLATVRHAREVFIEAIVTPAEVRSPGLERLLALIDNWIDYVRTTVFEGGCFFFAVSAEMDDQPGRVRDLIAHLTISWVRVLENETRVAISKGELDEKTDVEMLIFRIHGYVQEANWFFRLHNREDAFLIARKSASSLLIGAGGDESIIGEVQ